MGSLTREARATGQPARGAPAKGRQRDRRRDRRPDRPQLSPAEAQDKVFRLALITIIVIVVISYAAARVRRAAVGTGGLFDNDVFDLVGVFALVTALYLMLKAGKVARMSRERVSPTEASRMGQVTAGGILLWLVPIVGSFGYKIGLVFQASAMHPVYYGFVAGGIILIMVGLSGSKEKGSFIRLFSFAVYGIVIASIPIALPVFGDALASDSWWSSTFMMISIGFIFMSMTLRQMRQGQYSQLDEVVSRADAAFTARSYDQATRFYSEAITLTHTLYSDVVFSGRNPRERGGASVPEEYFRPWIGKAKCLALTGKLRKALAIYDLMLEVDPDNAKVWFDRGRILVAERRHAEAYISFDRAVKLDPNLEEAKRSRIEVLEVIRKMVP